MLGDWPKVAPLKKISSSMSRSRISTNGANSPTRKGHFALYTRDGQRFVVPITYLNTNIFIELFKMSEEEFGLPAGDSPIILPCDAYFMEHVVESLRDNTPKGWRKP